MKKYDCQCQDNFRYKQFWDVSVNQNLEAKNIMEDKLIESFHSKMGKSVEFFNKEIKLVTLEKIRFGLRDSWNFVTDFGYFECQQFHARINLNDFSIG